MQCVCVRVLVDKFLVKVYYCFRLYLDYMYDLFEHYFTPQFEWNYLNDFLKLFQLHFKIPGHFHFLAPSLMFFFFLNERTQSVLNVKVIMIQFMSSFYDFNVSMSGPQWKSVSLNVLSWLNIFLIWSILPKQWIPDLLSLLWNSLPFQHISMGILYNLLIPDLLKIVHTIVCFKWNAEL